MKQECYTLDHDVRFKLINILFPSQISLSSVILTVTSNLSSINASPGLVSLSFQVLNIDLSFDISDIIEVGSSA
jgi:hypothetical protein